jgi:asparagine synthase (glutamine-hydrolysing)
VWLTFNGEIYNFRALRRDLEQLGRVFTSESDTEVILQAYEEWGEPVR